MRPAWRAVIAALMALTVVLHVVQIVLYPPSTSGARREAFTGSLEAAQAAAREAASPQRWSEHQPPPSPPPAAASTAAVSRLAQTGILASSGGGGGGSRLMLVTATQPNPCTTRKGDHMLSLSVKNKWQYASTHGHRLWLSTELLSPWDLPGQWNKVALLAALMEPGTAAGADADWLLWVDDDILFSDMGFEFPLQEYEAAEQWLVLWGDEGMTYELGDTEGVNTGTMLLRVNDWSRRLLAALASVASSALRPTLTNHDQGGLVHLLHSDPEAWRAHTRLEQAFTMNGHWPDYVGQFQLGLPRLRAPVWGSDRLPVIVHYSGCQVRGKRRARWEIGPGKAFSGVK
jgi:hypothetical protein